MIIEKIIKENIYHTIYIINYIKEYLIACVSQTTLSSPHINTLSSIPYDICIHISECFSLDQLDLFAAQAGVLVSQFGFIYAVVGRLVCQLQLKLIYFLHIQLMMYLVSVSQYLYLYICVCVCLCTCAAAVRFSLVCDQI